MNETTFGDSWDISWDQETKQDVILIDAEEGTIYLSLEDLREMIKEVE